MQPLLEVRRYRSEVESHSHDFHQIVLPLEGRLSMVVGGVAGTVSSECIAMVAAGQPHSFTGSRSNAFLVADIPTDSPPATEPSGALLWEHVVREPFVPTDAEQHQLIRYLAAATESGKLSAAQRTPACVLLLGTVAATLGLDEQGSWPAGLRAATAYVDAHLEWRLGVADLARVANVSASRLHALFRDHLGTTPQRFVSGRRLERASELLARSGLPVVEVAHRVGYGDQAAFSRAFRRHTGQTPLAMRAAAARREGRHNKQ